MKNSHICNILQFIDVNEFVTLHKVCRWMLMDTFSPSCVDTLVIQKPNDFAYTSVLSGFYHFRNLRISACTHQLLMDMHIKKTILPNIKKLHLSFSLNYSKFVDLLLYIKPVFLRLLKSSSEITLDYFIDIYSRSVTIFLKKMETFIDMMKHYSGTWSFTLNIPMMDDTHSYAYSVNQFLMIMTHWCRQLIRCKICITFSIRYGFPLEDYDDVCALVEKCPYFKHEISITKQRHQRVDKFTLTPYNNII